ncbi:hypothetical protein [Streptomyces prasinosporus]
MAVSRPETRQFEAFMTNLSYARRMVKAGRMLTPFRSPTIDIDDWHGGRPGSGRGGPGAS